MEQDVAFVQQLLQGNPQYAHALDVDDADMPNPPGLQRRLQRGQRAQMRARQASTTARVENAQRESQNDAHRCGWYD